MKSLIFYTKLYFMTKSLNKEYKTALAFKSENKTIEKEEVIKNAMRTWAKNSIDFSGSTIEVIGEENIPQGTGYLVAPNHASTFDIPAIMLSFDKLLSFVTKKENRRIPFVTKWLEIADCIAIDRTNPKETVRSMMKGVKLLKDGRPLVIFPEGTRTLTGELGEFKAGSFKFAKKANVKVLPVAISGTLEIMKKGSFKINSSNIKVYILPAIDSEKFTTNELAELTKQSIQDKLNSTRR